MIYSTSKRFYTAMHSRAVKVVGISDRFVSWYHGSDPDIGNVFHIDLF